MNQEARDQVSVEFCRQSSDLIDQAMTKIRHCFGQMTDNQIWWRPAESLNSIGNLALHISGNLRQWGVVPLSGESDDRTREEEFTARGKVASAELLDQLEQTKDQAKLLWSKVSAAQLTERITVQGFEVSLLQAMMHTSTHFVGHSHQIIMLTRLQLGDRYNFQWTPSGDHGQLPI